MTTNHETQPQPLINGSNFPQLLKYPLYDRLQVLPWSPDSDALPAALPCAAPGMRRLSISMEYKSRWTDIVR